MNAAQIQKELIEVLQGIQSASGLECPPLAGGSKPIDALPQKALDVILYGTGTEKLTIYYERANGRGTLERPFEGVVNNVARRLTETQSDAMRKELEECMSERPCPKCHGRRLSDISLAVTVGGMNIMDFCAMPISEELKFIDNLKLTGSMAGGVIRRRRPCMGSPMKGAEPKPRPVGLLGVIRSPGPHGRGRAAPCRQGVCRSHGCR